MPAGLRGLLIPGPGAAGVAFGMLRAAPRYFMACQLTCTSETVTDPDADLSDFFSKQFTWQLFWPECQGFSEHHLRRWVSTKKNAADKNLDENLQNRAKTQIDFRNT